MEEKKSKTLDNMTIGEFVEKTQKRATENAARKILGTVETNGGKKIPAVTGVFPEECDGWYPIGNFDDMVLIYWEDLSGEMIDGNKLGIVGIKVYPYKEMTLDDCMELAEKNGFGHCGTLHVKAESALSGKCFCYGNHGEHWEQIGTTCGYA